MNECCVTSCFLSVMHCQSQCQCILTVDYIAETRKDVFREADVVKSFTFHPKTIHCMTIHYLIQCQCILTVHYIAKEDILNTEK